MAIAGDAAVDAVLIAGDVFDRAVPPPDAVRLLSDTLERLVAEIGVTVVAIAGNHDSPERLEFCGGVLARTGLHIVGRAAVEPLVVDLAGGGAPAQVAAIPYTEPPLARDLFDDDSLRSHDDVMERLAAAARARLAGTVPAVLVAHAYVAGGSGSESERPLSIGGSDLVEADRLRGFDYVALGHLHRAQQVGVEHVRYAGSLLKYSFAEAGQRPSVEVVELTGGRVERRRVELTPRRDLRRVEGTLAELLAAAEHDPRPADYIEAVLTDPGVVRDPMGRLRAVYPNLLHVARPALTTAAAAAAGLAAGRRQLGLVELFDAFYRERRERPLDESQREVLAEIAEAVAARDREAG